MPIYEYECPNCGRFEIIQKINDAPLAKCEKCGDKVNKVVSLSSFTLVGGGWYKDLYGSTNNSGKSSDSGGKSSSSSSSSSSTSTSSSSTTKSESKSTAAA